MTFFVFSLNNYTYKNQTFLNAIDKAIIETLNKNPIQDKVAAVLNVTKNHELVTLIPMEYPSKVTSAPKRSGVEEFTQKDTF